MSNSMHVSALVVFAVLLLSPFVNSGMVYEPDFNYDPIRKTLLIWMEKDMGEETDRLSFVSNFEKGEVELVAGEPYKKYKNYEPKKASLKKGNGKFCVDIDVYDPKVAGGFHIVGIVTLATHNSLMEYSFILVILSSLTGSMLNAAL
ncbi:uncharacterized protein HKW66_Vig0057690 [Vigna angularis]|uniref:Uncharacterized protein n=1 Tax=Phaseolus angularis TaxID=3914 RepID=A0A8T0L8B7_PHAAN|nr:uncharacterized protein HKW66_Vig0057690 [Vigna angularis]